jgi:hypothetical protein
MDASELQRPSANANGRRVHRRASFASGARCAHSGRQEPNAAEDAGLVAQGMDSIKTPFQRITGLQAFLRNSGRRIGPLP